MIYSQFRFASTTDAFPTKRLQKNAPFFRIKTPIGVRLAGAPSISIDYSLLRIAPSPI